MGIIRSKVLLLFFLVFISLSLSAGDLFKIGSPVSEVLKIQGRPDSVDKYPALGYNILRYKYSQVKISTRTDKVIAAVNISRNLKFDANNSGLDPTEDSTTNSTGGKENFNTLFDNNTGVQLHEDSSGKYDININYSNKLKYGDFYKSLDSSTNVYAPNTYHNYDSYFAKYGLDTYGAANINSSNHGIGGKPYSYPDEKYFETGDSFTVLLALMGRPDSIKRYNDAGYDVWNYGQSKVRISLKNGKILEWDNRGGNLKTKEAVK